LRSFLPANWIMGCPGIRPVRETRNRVVQVRRFGGPDGLEVVVDTPLPKAGRGEVRVRMLASGLEYTDVVIRRHLYPQTMRRRPPFNDAFVGPG
jgi:NADPH2:quinone reductase